MARRLAALLLALAVTAAWPLAGLAQAPEDLPGRVGRISDVAGELFLAPEDRAADWTPVGLNYPVTTGDNLWVGLDGRAEVDFGGGQFRMAGETNVHVSRLDDRTFGLFVAQGRINVHVRVLDAGDVARIDTPNTQITLTRPGVYRIDVGADRQSTLLVVREGEALAQVSAGLQQVLPGQTASIVGTDSVYADVRNGFAQDGFDAYSADRDRRYARNRSTAYVSRQMVGYADLDEYGSWQTYPEYGAVWFPGDVGADWAPYRNGYWTSVGGWGLTWVDFAPWGYAPFHYGRWAFVGGRWGWCPGSYVARPYWAPALVGWVGGPRWGVSVVGGGPVYGWVPLGWGEPYRPSWNNCGNRCWTQYNKPYAVNAAERPNAPPTRYVNGSAPNGVTAVSGSTFNSRKPVQNNLVRVNPAEMTAAPVLAVAPAVQAPRPGQIPGVTPGQRGTPPPASTFYATTKPGAMAPAGSAVPGAGRPLPSTSVAPADGSVRPSPAAGKPATGMVAVPPAAQVAPAQGTAAPPSYARPLPQVTPQTANPATNVAPAPGYAVPPSSARPGAAPAAGTYVPVPPPGSTAPAGTTSVPPSAGKPAPQGDRYGGPAAPRLESRQPPPVREGSQSSAPVSGPVGGTLRPSTAPAMPAPQPMTGAPAQQPAMTGAPAARPGVVVPTVPAAPAAGAPASAPAAAKPVPQVVNKPVVVPDAAVAK